ncbi:GlsB/YeaQ/YmgE family stress response membrane protein [Spongiactinospora sp. TRM90649]|uniref:GlsB/YeaQ/YmgE family stress response membrane protein n=1 Tax=Spongiactinospora sp. TRM90649 TaxID=3031114 RepID=UPI0023F6D7A3|nr:GlsB/YeaQ/YmgE family stress response membrane protein [Spongiactinospora sp. TRM90649]MDF5751706.1 GlsB/YeaQ/YmgE family stress response membrane protein [Spongiactinospora sp. TRM90649]
MLGTIISAIVVGAIIGVLARLIVPGRQNMSWGLTIIVGIVAALLGTLVAQLFGVATTPGIDWIELAFQIILAVIGVLIVSRLTTGGRGRA